MSFLSQTAKLQITKLDSADAKSSDAWQQALGLILALPLSLAGTAFLAYLLYAGSHIGS